MRKIKTSAVFAGIGFFISFVFGLFSGTGILIVLLKAIIFAVVFALLGFGICFLYDKFLTDDSSNDLSSDPVNGNSATNQPVQKGQIIDFTVQDEELPNGSSSNHFVVNNKHQMLHNEDTVGATKEPTVESLDSADNGPNDNGFVPLKNFENVNNISGKEAVAPSEVTPVEQPQESSEPPKPGNDLDVLPDMENFNFGSKTESQENSDDGDLGDSGESFSSSFSSSKGKSLEEVGIQDAALMAKAISSALSNDES